MLKIIFCDFHDKDGNITKQVAHVTKESDADLAMLRQVFIEAVINKQGPSIIFCSDGLNAKTINKALEAMGLFRGSSYEYPVNVE